MTKTYININGETRDATSLTVPAQGRMFRDAWQLNGDVIETDLTKARTIRAHQLAAEASNAAQLAERTALDLELSGRPVDATAARELATRRKARPNVSAVIAAADIAALAALTVDDIT